MTTAQSNARCLAEQARDWQSQFRSDVIRGLSKSLRTLPCKYLYDEIGSTLFDRICTLPAYYPTRTELAIMRGFGDEMANCCGPQCCIIEFGSGSSTKTRRLLDALHDPAALILIDLAEEHLQRAVARLAVEYPQLQIRAVCADYTALFDLPVLEVEPARNVVYFPGSTIGNFHPPDAKAFLQRIRALSGLGGGLLIGVDLKKDVTLLERAYNDSEGVTAAFNLNLLRRINRELGANFQIDRFHHRAIYDRQAGRIEMHLVCDESQHVTLNGTSFSFRPGESIRTECSYKYNSEEFGAMAESAGFEPIQVWVDDDQLFSVHYLAAR